MCHYYWPRTDRVVTVYKIFINSCELCCVWACARSLLEPEQQQRRQRQPQQRSISRSIGRTYAMGKRTRTWTRSYVTHTYRTALLTINIVIISFNFVIFFLTCLDLFHFHFAFAQRCVCARASHGNGTIRENKITSKICVICTLGSSLILSFKCRWSLLRTKRHIISGFCSECPTSRRAYLRTKIETHGFSDVAYI